MGEQRPLDALNGFVKSGLPAGQRRFFSRPDIVTGSYESRRFLAPATKDRPQTEFFEYHWAHLMQGNRLSDLRPTFLRVLLKPLWLVPRGLRLLWLLFWALVAAGAWALWVWPPAELLPEEDLKSWPLKLLGVLVGTGVWSTVLTFLLTKVGKILPGVLTNSFVDVVRYLDTSPRSYQVRHEIRKGFVELLKRLHTSEYDGKLRYQRVIIVAHSLGAYIAYDGISHLWGTMNNRAYKGTTEAPDGLQDVEVAAANLPSRGSKVAPTDQQIKAFREAQYKLWSGLRARGNPWLITDFVSVGTPMYCADILYTRTRKRFEERVKRRELPTCPPQNEEGLDDAPEAPPNYSYPWRGRQVLYDGAPFAVVRWTNLWFPCWPRRFGVLGDWFGGPLQLLFGNGIRDVPIHGNGWKRHIPGFAHALYFKFPDDRSPCSVTKHLDDALALGEFHLPPTDKQVAYALKLLGQAGFRTRKMAESHAELIDPRRSVPIGSSVQEWLRSLSRSEVSCLIDDLRRRQSQ
ncbi:hypothetical protein [Streptomyces spiramyceticus]|uniref:hypothetical protein n=1 Tax=Streptomyces spiramyceticus TaxID=299717 RepID=UPI00237AD8DD|nr:hypothetical protein [Streptomyces spiramyceticus]